MQGRLAIIGWMSDKTPAHQLMVESDSAQATEALGESLGKRLRGGEVIELVSDLGGGKTTLVRGLARGVGSTDQVASPTFTVGRTYEGGRVRLEHFDFYRLAEPGIIANELAEVLELPDTTVVIEWSDVVQHVLPPERITVTVTQTGEDSRHFSIAIPPAYDYLLKEPV